MGIVRHDPNAIAVSVLGGFSEATRAAGFAVENGPLEDSVAVFLDRLLKLRNDCSLLGGTFETYRDAVLSLPFEPTPQPTVLVPGPVHSSFRKLIGGLSRRMRDVYQEAFNLMASANDSVGGNQSARAAQLSNDAWFIVHHSHEYSIGNLLNRSTSLFSQCCGYISEVTIEVQTNLGIGP